MTDTAYQSDYTLHYDGKDITENLRPHLKNIIFRDHIDGKSDDVKIIVHDAQGRWKDQWMVRKGATLTVTIGELNCGTFSIDDITLSGPPSEVHIGALATGYDIQLRTRRTKSHEAKTHGQIIKDTAQELGLQVTGTIHNENMLYGRLTQRHMTPLAWLHHMGRRTGNVVSVRKNKLTYTSIYDVEAADTAATIDVTDISNYTIHDRFATTYNQGTLNYMNPQTGKLVTAKMTMSVRKTTDGVLLCKPDQVAKNYNRYYLKGVPKQDPTGSSRADSYDVQFSPTEAPNTYDGSRYSDFIRVSQDQIVIKNEHVENQQQAEALLLSELYHCNTDQRTARIKLPGNEYYLAGNSVKITGWGLYSGRYVIQSTEHIIDGKGGWDTILELKQMAVAVRPAKKAPPVKATSSGYGYRDLECNYKWTGQVRWH
jgi:phage protein D